MSWTLPAPKLRARVPPPSPPPPRTHPSSSRYPHRKPKPWDHDGIDHWKIDPFTAEDNKGGAPAEESSFMTLFPRYREQYLREVWPAVTSLLKKSGLKCELNLVEGSMSVATTRKTWDPFSVVQARDMLKLLARSVPLPQAQRVLEDGVASDIIKIGGSAGPSSKERFVKRRQRLLGPSGSTLKALELLTGCYVLVQGTTVSAVGPFAGLKSVRRVAEDCMQRNRHPIYHVKELMIRRELAKDPKMKDENWARFLPNFKAKNVPRRKPLQHRGERVPPPGSALASASAATGADAETGKPETAGRPDGGGAGGDTAAVGPTMPGRGKKGKKERTLFPPLPTPSKVDLAIESGEYFLTDAQKRRRKEADKQEKQETKVAEGKKRRAAALQPGAEPERVMPSPAVGGGGDKDATDAAVERLKASAKKKRKSTENRGGEKTSFQFLTQ